MIDAIAREPLAALVAVILFIVYVVVSGDEGAL